MIEYSITNDGILQSNLIEISHIKYACDTEEHKHDAIEFVYILSGKGEHIIDGRKEKVSRGPLVIIDCGQFVNRKNVAGDIYYAINPSQINYSLSDLDSIFAFNLSHKQQSVSNEGEF